MKTIRGKLVLILFMTIGGLILLLSLNFLLNMIQESSREKESSLIAIVDGSKDIKYNLAMTRKYEQQFLRAPDQPGADLITQSILRVKSDSDKLTEQIESKEMKAQFAKVNQNAEKYLMDFEVLSKMYQRAGYSSTEGIKGQIEGTASEITNLTKLLKSPIIDEQFLQMRLYEKQFLAARDKESYEQFVNATNVLTDEIQANTNLNDHSKKELSEKLFEYKLALNSIYSSFIQTEEFIVKFDEQASSIDSAAVEVEKAVVANQNILRIELEKQNKTYTYGVYAISLLLVLVLSITGYFLLTSITRSVRSLTVGAEKIGNGNLAYRVPYGAKDEMGALANTFNLMAEKVQQAFLHVLDSANQLQASSQHLTAISEETSAQATEVNEAIKHIAVGAEDQTAQLEASKTDIEQVTKAIRHTELLSAEIASEADLTEKEGHIGLNTVQDLQIISDQFLLLSNHLTEKVSEASVQSDNITSIVDTIQSIADNTNLLALNAAIEAARAGEAGKGFAVVATEVRKLAERSKQEAQNIHSLVSSMNTTMSQLMSESEKFNDYELRQSESVQMTKNAFENIVQHVKGINEKINTIEAAVMNVQASNSSLTERIQGVFNVSELSLAASEEVSASSETQLEAISGVNLAATELSQIAGDLQLEVNQFKLDSIEEQAIKTVAKKRKFIFKAVFNSLKTKIIKKRR
ncbi:methyl-accepting chemotaxis protein [Bacillus sp. FJAT-29790]|uniref:methyl-accepting chemotaxis protein n=1 Tax=Bacillus sp. FJAT-29790 TaxID=1895002 RepID=UPI001C230F7D|nr:methyl-accepting chemotaxis protein [Bacillus sp. FJAT-29790]MBU8879768.1 methyl-accepting chemotaxis protein [Bacillus sp. FJAT-29790]